MSNRVVITGLGLVTPIGIQVHEFWMNLLSGKSGASEISSFDTSDFKNKIGCEVKTPLPEKYLGLKGKGYGRSSQMALVASRMALEDAGLDLSQCESERIGISLGTTIGEPHFIERLHPAWYEAAEESFRLFKSNGHMMSQLQSETIAANVASEIGLLGPNTMIPAACAAGNYAISHGYDLIQSGQADCMLAGGVDSFSRIAFAGFSRLHAMSTDVCRPFDKNRKGLLLAEGAGILLMESFESAKKRGAKIYAEVLGYGLSCDAYHITSPHPEGMGAAMAMTKALKKAKVSIDEVRYINAHGTGTLQNDKIETLAIKKVFGDLAYDIPVSSIKGLTGHSMGAASAIEAIACVLSIERGIVPPTYNYQEPDPECDLDYVPNAAREMPVNVVLNNSHAFGGNNAVVVFALLK